MVREFQRHPLLILPAGALPVPIYFVLFILLIVAEQLCSLSPVSVFCVTMVWVVLLVYFVWWKEIFFKGLFCFSHGRWYIGQELSVLRVRLLAHSVVTRFLILLYCVDEAGTRHGLFFYTFVENADFRYLHALLTLDSLRDEADG